MVRETVTRTCDGCGEQFSDPFKSWWRLEAEGEHERPKVLMVLGENGSPREAPFVFHSLQCLRGFIGRNQEGLA